MYSLIFSLLNTLLIVENNVIYFKNKPVVTTLSYKQRTKKS